MQVSFESGLREDREPKLRMKGAKGQYDQLIEGDKNPLNSSLCLNSHTRTILLKLTIINITISVDFLRVYK